MTILVLIAGLVISLFGFALLFGAPYVPTLKKQVEVGLDLLDLKPGTTLLELGSGDGRVLLAAAKRGLNVVGYELNPLLILISWLRTWHYRQQVRVVWGNFWTAKWPKADGMFVFLLDKYMSKLNKKIIQEISVTCRPAAEPSSSHRRRSLRWALLLPAILLRRRQTTPQSVSLPQAESSRLGDPSRQRLAQHQSAEDLPNRRSLKVVSFAFKIPGKQAKQVKDGLYLYEYQ